MVCRKASHALLWLSRMSSERVGNIGSFLASTFTMASTVMRNGIDRFKWRRPLWEIASTVSNGNDRLRKGNLHRRLCRKETLREQFLKLFKTLTARVSVIKSKNSRAFIKHCSSYSNAGHKQHDNEETNLAPNQWPNCKSNKLTSTPPRLHKTQYSMFC